MAMEEETSPENLRLRVALLEQQRKHDGQISDMRRSASEARIAVMEQQIHNAQGQVSWLFWKLNQQHEESAQSADQLASRLQGSLSDLGARQDALDKLAVRLRYGLSVLLILPVVGNRMAPETYAKVSKFLGLIPF